MKCLCVIDFTLENTTNGHPIVYFDEVFPNLNYLQIFLNRVKKLEGLSHIVALIHPSLEERLKPYFEDLEQVEIYLTPEQESVLYYSGHNTIINSRKWNYNTFRGGCNETNYLDEVLPMELIKQIGEQVDTQSILYLNPEQPVFDISYTNKMIEIDQGKMENRPPFLYRQTVQGLSPVIITKNGLDHLKNLNWSPRLVLGAHKGGDGAFILRQKVENEPEDLTRGSFLLRDQRESSHLKYVLTYLEDNGLDWSAKNLIYVSKLFVEKMPREIDLEASGTAYPEKCNLPQDIPSEDMPVELFSKIYDEICSWETGLLSIGELSNILKHEEEDELFQIINEKKPYGLHLILNAETLLMEEHLNKWLTLPLDILTLRLTPLSESLFYKIKDCDKIIDHVLKQYGGESKKVCPNINLELHKNEDNIEDIHEVVNLAERYSCSYNWIAHNDYCKQVAPSLVIQSTPFERYPCEKLLNQVYVLSNGKISSCKQDFSGKTTWGDLSENTIIECWNAKEWTDARLKQINGDYLSTNPFCKSCYQWVHP